MSHIKFKDPSNGREHDYTLKRSVYEQECMPLFEKCTKAVERAFEDSKMSHEEVDEIVLVGGSCKIPKIRQDLVEHFGS